MIVPPVIITIEPPAGADNAPPLVLLTPAGVAIINPLGKLSAKLVIAVALAFAGCRGIHRANNIVEHDHAPRGAKAARAPRHATREKIPIVSSSRSFRAFAAGCLTLELP